MGKFSGPHDNTTLGKVPRVAQVFWSQKRRYHGDKVTLSVRTQNVPDGAAVELRILPKGGGAVIDTITGDTLTGSQVNHVYTIDWKTKTIPDGAREFVFQAVIGKVVSSASPTLFVDLALPEPSV